MISQLTQIGNRLNQYLLFRKISIHTLAREAGISSTLITNILHGGSYDFIFFVKLISHLPDLNLNWVFTGNGEMVLKPCTEDTYTPGIQANTPQSVRSELKLLSAQNENARLRKQLEERNDALRRLKETLGPVQSLLMDMD